MRKHRLAKLVSAFEREAKAVPDRLFYLFFFFSENLLPQSAANVFLFVRQENNCEEIMLSVANFLILWGL